MPLPFLRTVVIGSPDAQDLYCDWQRVREIDEGGVLLVRPDGHIAWRVHSPVEDAHTAGELLRKALAAILNNPTVEELALPASADVFEPPLSDTPPPQFA
jgi:2,4-dichlorophenol 6-monooxygenase